jgi:hypothetical protein
MIGDISGFELSETTVEELVIKSLPQPDCFLRD